MAGLRAAILPPADSSPLVPLPSPFPLSRSKSPPLLVHNSTNKIREILRITIPLQLRIALWRSLRSPANSYYPLLTYPTRCPIAHHLLIIGKYYPNASIIYYNSSKIISLIRVGECSLYQIFCIVPLVGLLPYAKYSNKFQL